MKVNIPNSAFLGNINSFLSTMDTNNSNVLHIEANPNWIAIHPLVLSMIGALGSRVGYPRNIACDDILARSGHYLTRMELFKFLKINPKVKEIKKHESAGRFIPLTQIKDSKELVTFLKELVPLLHLDREPKHAQAIQHIFSELIRNVLEHANSPIGSIVCAQYLKKTNRIAIGVVDTGVGLKETLRRSYPVRDDLDAIRLALTPGITGTTNRPGGSEQNAGLGLFLIKTLAYINSDFFVIISGEKLYKLKRRPASTRLVLKRNPLEDRYSTMDISPWQGVAIGIDISLDKTWEFKTSLNIISKFYSKEIRQQKKQRYKKPKFI